jgi:hypothetical protein
MLATVSLLSTSKVAVFPVSVFTKICISPLVGDCSPETAGDEEWGFGGVDGVAELPVWRRGRGAVL